MRRHSAEAGRAFCVAIINAMDCSEFLKVVRKTVKNCLKAAYITVAGNKTRDVFTVKTLVCTDRRPSFNSRLSSFSALYIYIGVVLGK